MIIDENKMDAATAVSGSGPGFIYYIISKKTGKIFKTKQPLQHYLNNEFKSAAKKVGFNLRQAKLLADTTVRGSLCYWIQSRLTLDELEKRVASKGGTTEAGLKILGKGYSLVDAVKAAAKRAKELSKKE